MVSAAACAHALEGLRIDLERRVDDTELRAAPAAEQRLGRGMTAATNAVLGLALGVDMDTWRGRLHDLFETLRNPAVHPRAQPREPVPHPDVERAVSVSHESALYWLDSARASVDLSAK
jgi:hypothetical protein